MDQQNNPSQQPQTEPLNFVPQVPTGGPEGSVESIVPVAERVPVSPEKPLTQENEPIFEDNKTSKPAPEPAQPQVLAKPQEQPAKVVDKSHEPVHTHHIEHPQDKLTAEADREEEEFIEKVETAHEHK